MSVRFNAKSSFLLNISCHFVRVINNDTIMTETLRKLAVDHYRLILQIPEDASDTLNYVRDLLFDKAKLTCRFS